MSADKNFALHTQLDADTHKIGTMELCQVLLMNNSVWPWVILVPQRADVKEMHDLSEQDQLLLMKEMMAISTALKKITGADKMNVANLGNMVSQLHIHIIGRLNMDPAWPNPVWGTPHKRPWTPTDLKQFTANLKNEVKGLK